MHNNIMAAGSRDHPPMLATRRYSQWQSHFMRYIDTRPNAVETLLNISPKNKAHYESEKEAIHFLLTGIGDEIYSTVDACKTAHEMWIAIKRLQQVKSYYSRYKGKEIAKPITPPSKSASEEDRDLEQAQKDKEMQRNLALIAKNQRTVTIAGARETVGSQVVQQTRIHCFNFQEFGHFVKECRKPKRAKDYTYHKEKMLLCKQAEKGVPLQAEQVDRLDETDEEIDEQELEAHYNYMAKIQEVLTADSETNIEPLEKVKQDDNTISPASSNMCDNDNQDEQNVEKCDDKRDALELNECKITLKKTNRTREESNSIRDSCLIAFQNKEIELEKYKAYNDRTPEYDKLERLVKEKNKVITDLKCKEEKDLDKLIAMEKQLKFLNKIVYKRNQSVQTIHLLATKGSTYNERPAFANPMYLTKAQSEKPCLYEIPYDKSDIANIFAPDREAILTLEQVTRSKLNKDLVKPYDYTKQNSLYEIFKPPSQECLDLLEHANKIRKKMWRKSFVKFVTAYIDSLKSRTSNVNVVCATCEKCVFNSNHDACVSILLNDVNAKTKRPKVVPISTRKLKSQVNKSVATPPKKTVVSDFTIQKSKSYYSMLYEKTSQA
ncbi:hypothetical protein Tco_1251517 [Tanacetum coccineum]